MPAAITLDVETTQYRIRVNKGEDCTLTIPVLDKNDNQVPVPHENGWTAIARVCDPTSGAELYTWSFANDTLVCTNDGVVLTLLSDDTSAWAWNDADFECVLMLEGKRGRIGEGPFTAVDQLIPPNS